MHGNRPRATTGRIYYLDALRSFCMLFGVFVHANTLFDPFLYPVIDVASSHFRMATFFMVSGFFVALVAQRTSFQATLSRRSLAILVPFFSALILLNPVTNYLVHIYHNPWMSPGAFFSGGWREPAAGPGVWLLHLWFLPVLWVYVIASPALHWLCVSGLGRRLAARAAGWHPDLLALVLALGVALTVIALRAVHALTLEPLVDGTRLAWTVRATLSNLPYFALGVALQSAPVLFRNFHRISWPTLLLGLGLSLGVARFSDLLPGPAASVGPVFAKAFLTTTIIAALLWISRALFSGENALVKAVTESIYTVYLFHYFAIYVWGNLLAGTLGGPALYFAVVILTFLSTFLLHRQVIARIPVVRLMFNGRPRTPLRRPVPQRS